MYNFNDKETKSAWDVECEARGLNSDLTEKEKTYPDDDYPLGWCIEPYEIELEKQLTM